MPIPSSDFDDTSWFYGNSKKRKAVNCESSPSVSRPESKRTTLVDFSSGFYKAFTQQRKALKELESSKNVFKKSRVFSCERSSDGSRSYIVTTAERFWSQHGQDTSPSFYELIPEDTPCRLYFDLEFKRSTNKNLDENEAFQCFVLSLCSALKSEYNINLTEDRLLILDSSSEEKYSKHVICHFENDLLFPSNVSIQPLLEKLKDEIDWNSSEKIWNSDGSKETTLFDTAVYSRNRNFRLYKSTKRDQNRFLVLSPDCSFYKNKKPSDFQIFLDSLCVPEDYATLPLIEPLLNTDSACTAKVPTNAPYESTKEGIGPSPYSYLDEFMLRVLRQWSSSAYIKQWKLQSNEIGNTSVIYYPGNCRYCFNIGRQHKSNGTYWTVNLERKEFYQKCFDPECNGARSNCFPIPKFVAETLGGANDLHSKEDVDSFFEESFHEVNKYFTNWEQVFDS